jgi:DNA polymerase-1
LVIANAPINTRCLIDADILQYEIGFASEAYWKHLHPEASLEWLVDNPPPWEIAEAQLLGRIQTIEDECEATEPSTFYFSGKKNFRYEIAVSTPYKAGRGYKPYHYKNIGAFLNGLYECRRVECLEADDLIGIEYKPHSEAGRDIICTRDKDLRALSGWHYGWELGKQPRFGPTLVAGYGVLELSRDRKKLSGYGLKWFLAQCLTGDTTDSIPGVAKCGVVAAYDLLNETSSYEEGLGVVRGQYLRKGYSEAYLLEQGRLLWMTRELNPDGSPVLWCSECIYEE